MKATNVKTKNTQALKTLGISLKVNGGSPLTSFVKTKNPDFNIKALYSRRVPIAIGMNSHQILV